MASCSCLNNAVLSHPFSSPHLIRRPMRSTTSPSLACKTRNFGCLASAQRTRSQTKNESSKHKGGIHFDALAKFVSWSSPRTPSVRDVKNLAIIRELIPSQQTEKEEPFSLDLNENKTLIMLNVLAFGYALTAIMVKVMDQHGALSSSHTSLPLTSLEFTLRFGFASLLFTWPSIIRQKAWVRREYSEEDIEGRKEGITALLLNGIELGVWMFCTYAGQAIGLETSTANHATLLLTLSVVLVPFLESFFGRKIELKLWISAVMVCCGVVMLETGGFPGLGFSVSSDCLMKGIPAGHIWCLLGALGSAIHVVRAEMMASKFDTMSLLTVQMLTTTALSFVWFSMDLSHCTPSCADMGKALLCLPWPMIFLSGPVGTAMCEWLELEGLQFLSASKATLILMASPLWTSVIAYFWLGETLDASSAFGGILILLASVQTQLTSSSHTEK